MHRTDFLQELVLLRNDPAVVVTVRAEAMKGNPHAQYALGLIYAEGRGVDVELAESWAWLTLAVMQGDRDAEVLRNVVGSKLSDEEYNRGKALAGELARKIDPVKHAH